MAGEAVVEVDQLCLELQPVYGLRPVGTGDGEYVALEARRDTLHEYRLSSRLGGVYIQHWKGTGWTVALRLPIYAAPNWGEGVPQNYGQLARYARTLLAEYLVTTVRGGS